MNAQDRYAAASRRCALLRSILLREDKGGVAILTLNRPQARNSLSEAMLEALGDALTAIAHDARCAWSCWPPTDRPSRPATISKSSMRAAPTPIAAALISSTSWGCAAAVMQQIVTLPQPVIAAVQATATAAGCQLVASCDLAVASHSREIRDARRQYRAVLLDADGGAVAQRFAQSRHGNAAHWRYDLRRRRSPHRSRQSRRRCRQRSAMRRSSLPKRSPASRL